MSMYREECMERHYRQRLVGQGKGIVQLLVANGADVNIQGGDCRTALRAAALWSNESIVQLLLTKG